MARNSAQPDSLTLVIEDPTHAAVNISHLAANSFDYYMSTNLLLPLGTKDAAGGSTAPGSVGQQIDPREQLQRNQSSRWIPRPSFAQIEGITLQDPTADFQISIGMISGRGGTAASSATVGSDLVIQVSFWVFMSCSLQLTFQFSAGILAHKLSTLFHRIWDTRRLPAGFDTQTRYHSGYVRRDNKLRLEESYGTST
jgi:hypothetical protein